MHNIIKYELRGQIKNIMGMLIVLSFVNLVILYYSKVLTIQGSAALTLVTGFAAFIAVLIAGIKTFTKDLYEDTGYLLYQTPTKGIYIVGGKIIFSVIQVIFLTLISILFMLPYILQVDDLPYPTFKSIVYIGAACIFMYSFLLASIYFSAAVSKLIARSKKWGKLSGFLIFIIFWTLFGNVSDFLSNIFNYNINFNMLTFKSSFAGAYASFSAPSVSLNIISMIFQVVVFVLLLIGTSYIIEQKIDL
ncbi:MAG: hypothetical protein K0R54_5122 [Clostridiaceae bacterium]|nr:hypothetical protein [Clostridiaceae bacterium]